MSVIYNFITNFLLFPTNVQFPISFLIFFSVFFFVIRSYFKEKISLKSAEQFPYNPTIDCPAKNKKEKKMTSCDLEISFSYFYAYIYSYVYVSMSVCAYIHVSAGTLRDISSS